MPGCVQAAAEGRRARRPQQAPAVTTGWWQARTQPSHQGQQGGSGPSGAFLGAGRCHPRGALLAQRVAREARPAVGASGRASLDPAAPASASATATSMDAEVPPASSTSNESPIRSARSSSGSPGSSPQRALIWLSPRRPTVSRQLWSKSSLASCRGSSSLGPRPPSAQDRWDGRGAKPGTGRVCVIAVTRGDHCRPSACPPLPSHGEAISACPQRARSVPAACPWQGHDRGTRGQSGQCHPLRAATMPSSAGLRAAVQPPRKQESSTPSK